MYDEVNKKKKKRKKNIFIRIADESRRGCEFHGCVKYPFVSVVDAILIKFVIFFFSSFPSLERSRLVQPIFFFRPTEFKKKIKSLLG